MTYVDKPIPSELPPNALPFFTKRMEYFGCNDASVLTKWLDNRSLSIQERNSRKTILSCKPLYVDVELNRICNYKCLFCFCHGMHSKDRLTFEDIDKLAPLFDYAEIIETSKAAEPFSTPDLFVYFLQKARQNNPFSLIHSVTNGSILSDQLLNAIFLYKLDHIYISINSDTEDKYKEISGGGSLHKVLNNIKKINEYKTKFSSLEPFLHINCQMSDYVNPLNLLDMAGELGIIEINFIKTMTTKQSVFHGHGMHQYMSENELQSLGNLMAEKGKKYEIYLNFPGLPISSPVYPCRNSPEYYPPSKYFNLEFTCPTDAPWFRFCTSMYDVAPCCWSASFDSWKEKSFDEIWNGEHLTSLRKSISQGQYPSCCRCRY